MILYLRKRILQRHLQLPINIESKRYLLAVNKPPSYLIDCEQIFQGVYDECVSDCRDMRLRMGNVASPKSLGQGGDTRKLGIGMTTMNLLTDEQGSANRQAPH